MVKRKKHKPKITKTFLNVLAVISIIGFALIFFKSILDLDWGMYLPMILMIVFGVGLVIEGQVRFWPKFFRGGLTSDEFTHIFTGLWGLIAITIGGLGFIEFIRMTPIFNSMLGIFAVFAVAIIVIDTWVVE